MPVPAATLLTAMHYNAAGQLTSDTLGDAEAETYTYDTRLRLQSMSSALNSTPIYSYGLTFAPNSNITAANDSVNGNWNYSYDQFNRVACANLASNGTCATPPTGTPTYTYVYDRFGNRWQQNGTNSMQLSFTGNATTNNNRMDGYSYDSAGNLLYDNVHHYFYDAENRLIQVDGTLPYCTSNGASGTASTACYYYDAEGHRVFRTGYTNDTCDGTGKRNYLYDLAGHDIVENNYSSTACFIELYVGDRHLARQGGGTFFYHNDWLGTNRKINSYTNPTTWAQTCTSLPFGDALNCNNINSNVDHLTGKERDFESGLDNFGARYNSSNFGRFTSPDPKILSMRHVVNPQKWNKYAYVLNNPLVYFDPDGRDEKSLLSKILDVVHVQGSVGVGIGADVNISGVKVGAEASMKSQGTLSAAGNVTVSVVKEAGVSMEVGKEVEVGYKKGSETTTVKDNKPLIEHETKSTDVVGVKMEGTSGDASSSNVEVLGTSACALLCLGGSVGVDLDKAQAAGSAITTRVADALSDPTPPPPAPPPPPPPPSQPASCSGGDNKKCP